MLFAPLLAPCVGVVCWSVAAVFFSILGMSSNRAAEVAAWGSKLVETSKAASTGGRVRNSSYPTATKPPPAAARFDDPHAKCKALAQRLVDEEQELQNCENILHDNERKFRERRAELLEALANVQRSLKPITRASADDVRVKEEALWHMQATCERLEREEADQGEAVVRLVDCVSCAEECKARSLGTMREVASLLRTGVFPLVGELREVCSGFPFVGDLHQTEFRDDVVALQRLNPLVHEDEVVRISSALHHVLHHLDGGVEEFRASARDRLHSILQKGESMRQECDAQAAVVEEAHAVLMQLKEQQQETEEAAEGASRLMGQLSGQIEGQRAGVRGLQREVGEIAARLEAARISLRRKADVKTQLTRDIVHHRDHIREAANAVEALERAKAHDDVVCTDLSAQVEDVDSRTSGLRRELTRLQREVGEEEGAVSTSRSRLAGLREQDASIRADTDKCKEEIARLTSDIGALTHREAVLERSAGELKDKVDALLQEERDLESLLQVGGSSLQNGSVALEAALDRVADEERSTADIERDLQTAKRLLLEQRQQQPANNSSFITASSLELSPSPARSLPVEDARAAIRSYRASRVENAVVTAPLKRLLVSNERSPVTVPLEVRHHRMELERGRAARPEEIRARMVAARSPSR